MSNLLTFDEGTIESIQFFFPDGMDVRLLKGDSTRVIRISGVIQSIRYCELQGVLNPAVVSEAPFKRDLEKITLDESSRTEADYGTVIYARMQFHYRDGGDPTTFNWRLTDDRHAISVQLVKRVDGKAKLNNMHISLR